MSNLYNRVCGIRPSPLYKQHLQPSNPPPSATKEQLALFSRVLVRRSNQLNLLPIFSLQAAFDLLTEDDKPTAKEIKALLQILPKKKPSEDSHYISLIRYLLVENFHISIDTRVKPEAREESLTKVRHILYCLDIAYLDFTETGEQESEKPAADAKNSTISDNLTQQESDQANPKQGQAEVRTSAAEVQSKPTALAAAPTGIEEAKQTTGEKVTPASTIAVALQKSGNFNKTTDHQGKQAKAENLNSSMGILLSKGRSGTGADDAIEIIDDEDVAISTDSKVQHSKKEKSVPLSSHEASSENKIAPPEKKEDTSNSPEAKKVQQQSEKTTTKSQTQLLAIVEAKKDLNSRMFALQRRRQRVPSHHPIRNVRSHRQLYFDADKKSNVGIPSGSLHERGPLQLKWWLELGNWTSKPEGYIDGPALDDVTVRLAKWDPFWKVVEDLSVMKVAQTEIGWATSRIIGHTSRDSGETPLSACRFDVNLSKVANQLTWGARTKYQHHDKRLLLRALPLVVPKKYKKLRSDTHLWPKGTYLQFFNTGRPRPIMIQQRKQQSHDPSLWKGMCKMADLTTDVIDIGAPVDLAICTRDTDTYYFQLAICEYTSPQALFKHLMGQGPRSIIKLSPEEGRALVKKNLDEKDTVNLDSDDDNDDNGTGLDLDSIYLTCSLLCSVSMQAIRVPVRGKHCKHMQCFDLENYIATHATVHGGRWRCAVCDDFVPVQDLMMDGFIAEILDELRNYVSSSRDKVEIYGDGTWKFLDENKLRYQKKRLSSSDLPDNKRIKVQGNGGNNVAHAEVIDILDDD